MGKSRSVPSLLIIQRFAPGTASSQDRVPWPTPLIMNLLLASRDGISEEETRGFPAAERTKMVEFLHGCDLAMLDTRSTDEEFVKPIGWSHSRLNSAVSLALDADVDKLLLFHHDPNPDDETIDKRVKRACALVATSGDFWKSRRFKKAPRSYSKRRLRPHNSYAGAAAFDLQRGQSIFNFSRSLPRGVTVALETLDLSV